MITTKSLSQKKKIRLSYKKASIPINPCEVKILQKAVGKTLRDKIRTEITREMVGVRNSQEFISLKITPSRPQLAIIKCGKCHKITFVVVLLYLFVFVLIPIVQDP